MNKDDSPFFLAVNHVSNREYYHAWFKEMPMGINNIYSLTKKMVQSCPDIEGGRKLTNHSARKHLIQKLQDKGVENAQIMQISGHKNVASINTYSRLNEQQQKSISEVLTDTTGQTNYNAGSKYCPATTCTSMDVIPSKPSTSTQIQVPSLCSSQMSSELRVSSYFQGSTHIHGGTFNFINNYGCGDKRASENTLNEPQQKKYKRILPLHFSDSDSD